jgi:hypothetical protein
MAVLFGWGGQQVLLRPKAMPGFHRTIRHEPVRMQDVVQPVERAQFREESGHCNVEILLLVIPAEDQKMQEPGYNRQQPGKSTKEASKEAQGGNRRRHVKDNRIRKIDRAPQQVGRVFVALPPRLPVEYCLYGTDDAAY